MLRTSLGVTAAPARGKALHRLFALVLGGACLTGVGSAQAGLFDDLFGASAPEASSAQFDRPHAPARRRVQGHTGAHATGTGAGVASPASGSSSKQPQFCSLEDRASKPLDRTEALMRDATLRPGDVIMTDEGVRVFAGRAACPHSVRDFQTLAEARALPRQKRVVLAAIEQATKVKRFGATETPIVAADPAGRPSPAKRERRH